MLFSQIIPPLPSPAESKRLSIHLCLFCCLAYRVIITIFLNSIYMRLVYLKKFFFNLFIFNWRIIALQKLLVLYGSFPLAIYFKHGSVYMSEPLAQFVSPYPSPAVSTSSFSTYAFLFFPCR